MHLDPSIPIIVAAILTILLLGVLMKRLNQPHVIVYLLVGLILGPNVIGLISDQVALTRLGSFGVVLLLFFIGMEVSPQRLIENWFVSVLGTLGQVLASVAVVAFIGSYLHWPLARIVLLGFVISLSSTAVVLKLLEDWKEMDTRVGQDVLGILLVQDLIVVPMMIILGFLGGHKPGLQTLTLQAIGGGFIISVVVWLLSSDEVHLPWLKRLGVDHEMQVFTALGLCFGMALITGLTELSAALGAFVAGMLVSSAKETHWVYQSLSSVRVIFIAFFFVSIGMLIDVNFIIQYWLQVTLLLVAAFATNFLINALILRALGERWSVSIYGASLLAQIGEFSFVIAAVGYQMKIINGMGYQITISVISLSLLVSPLWIAATKMLINKSRLRLSKA